MQSVFGLVENGPGMLLEGLFGYLFSPVWRQTVQHQGSGGGTGHKVFVYLKRFKLPETFGAFVFKPHAYPNVGIENVRPVSAGNGIICDDDFTICESCQQRSVRPIVLRSRNSKF